MPPIVMTMPIWAGDHCRACRKTPRNGPRPPWTSAIKKFSALSAKSDEFMANTAGCDPVRNPAVESNWRPKDEERARCDQHKADHMVPGDCLLQIDHRENA